MHSGEDGRSLYLLWALRAKKYLLEMFSLFFLCVKFFLVPAIFAVQIRVKRAKRRPECSDAQYDVSKLCS